MGKTEPSFVDADTTPKGALDFDTIWEGLECEDVADSLSKVMDVARNLEADEIGFEETM